MKRATPYPLLFQPIYKDYIWGGKRIAETYNRQNTPDVCAESWEIADRPEGMSIVSNGVLAGTTLRDLVKEWGQKLIGTSVRSATFPLLIKIIDASKRLSLQVHPNDTTARQYGGEPKTECWYVLGTQKDAFMYAGFNRHTNTETFVQLLERGEAQAILHEIPARPHETIFIPGGRVHAIGEGCLLLEVQQNSNTTYRVYDWGRVGHDGKPRALHVEQAIRVIDWDDLRPKAHEPRHVHPLSDNPRWELVSSPYFRLERVKLNTKETVLPSPESFSVLFVEKGNVCVSCGGVNEDIAAGTSCMIPAAAATYGMQPLEDGSSVVVIRTC